VKFSMRFRGREVMYVELGKEKFNTIIERLADVSVVEEQSPMRGSYVYIILTPSKAGQKPPAKPGQPAR